MSTASPWNILSFTTLPPPTPTPTLPFLSGEECRHRDKSKVGRRYHLVILASGFREHGCVYTKNFLRFTSSDRQHLLVIYCNQLLFSFPVGVFFLSTHMRHHVGRRKGQPGEVINLGSYLCGGQVASHWPCKLYWHWRDIHLVYPYSHSPSPFMKTCAICHRVSPWHASLINRSMRGGWDLLAQHLSGPEPRDRASIPARKSNKDADC